MNCKKCGNEMGNYDRFCKACGAPIKMERAFTGIETSPQYNQSQYNRQQNKKSLITKTWFIILMLFLFFPVGLYLMWNSKWNTAIKVIVSTVFIIGLIGTAIDANTAQVDSPNIVEEEFKQENKQEVLKKEEPKEVLKTEEEIKREFLDGCKRFTYKDIERDPDNFKDKAIKLDGEVIQVSEGLFNSLTLRVASSKDEYGLPKDIYLVTYSYSEGESRILEEDNITIWGVCSGVDSYTSVLGGTITIPSVKLKYYQIAE